MPSRSRSRSDSASGSRSEARAQRRSRSRSGSKPRSESRSGQQASSGSGSRWGAPPRPKADASRLVSWGLAALLLLDVSLVTLAVRNPFRSSLVPDRSAGTVSSTGTSPSGASTAASGGGASARPATGTSTGGAGGIPSSGTAGPAGESVVVRGVGIAAVDGRSAWRFVQGRCPGGGAGLARTTDGGRTWVEVASPLTAISRVQLGDPGKVTVVGADRTCGFAAKRSSDDGATWGEAGGPALWYRSSANPSQVVNTTGRTSTPCGPGEVRSVTAVSVTAAAALCASGRIVETADAGATWVELGRAVSAVALSARVEGGRLVALVAYRTGGCSGLATAAVSGSTVTSLGCADLVGRSADGLLDRSALTVAGNSWWLVVDNSVLRSDDDGVSWSPAESPTVQP